ncbi:MAG: BON domain-containing protein [Acidobacteria bacterium]|nr:BON domain-containing protein [Acidobacteriota bacterium]
MTDHQLRDFVIKQLDWEPEVTSTEIGVSGYEGVVTLTGFVDTYAEKLAAERAVKLVSGVRGIANDIQVRASSSTLTDQDLTQIAVHALETRTNVPEDRIVVIVKDGNLVLEGEVEWAYQKESAEEAVKYLRGVRNVFNEIKIKPKISTIDIERDLEGALARSSIFGERQIRVEAHDGVVTLSGVVRSLREKADAERIAWSTPGVSQVFSQLIVSRTICTGDAQHRSIHLS